MPWKRWLVDSLALCKAVHTKPDSGRVWCLCPGSQEAAVTVAGTGSHCHCSLDWAGQQSSVFLQQRACKGCREDINLILECRESLRYQQHHKFQPLVHSQGQLLVEPAPTASLQGSCGKLQSRIWLHWNPDYSPFMNIAPYSLALGAGSSMAMHFQGTWCPEWCSHCPASKPAPYH